MEVEASGELMLLAQSASMESSQDVAINSPIASISSESSTSSVINCSDPERPGLTFSGPISLLSAESAAHTHENRCPREDNTSVVDNVAGDKPTLANQHAKEPAYNVSIEDLTDADGPGAPILWGILKPESNTYKQIEPKSTMTLDSDSHNPTPVDEATIAAETPGEPGYFVSLEDLGDDEAKPALLWGILNSNAGGPRDDQMLEGSEPSDRFRPELSDSVSTETTTVLQGVAKITSGQALGEEQTADSDGSVQKHEDGAEPDKNLNLVLLWGILQFDNQVSTEVPESLERHPSPIAARTQSLDSAHENSAASGILEDAMNRHTVYDIPPFNPDPVSKPELDREARLSNEGNFEEEWDVDGQQKHSAEIDLDGDRGFEAAAKLGTGRELKAERMFDSRLPLNLDLSFDSEQDGSLEASFYPAYTAISFDHKRNISGDSGSTVVDREDEDVEVSHEDSRLLSPSKPSISPFARNNEKLDESQPSSEIQRLVSQRTETMSVQEQSSSHSNLNGDDKPKSASSLQVEGDKGHHGSAHNIPDHIRIALKQTWDYFEGENDDRSREIDALKMCIERLLNDKARFEYEGSQLTQGLDKANQRASGALDELYQLRERVSFHNYVIEELQKENARLHEGNCILKRQVRTNLDDMQKLKRENHELKEELSGMKEMMSEFKGEIGSVIKAEVSRTVKIELGTFKTELHEMKDDMQSLTKNLDAFRVERAHIWGLDEVLGKMASDNERHTQTLRTMQQAVKDVKRRGQTG